MKNIALKIYELIRRLTLGTIYGAIMDYRDWKEELWDRDLDENDCCDGRECGCSGRTVRQNYKRTYSF